MKSQLSLVTEYKYEKTNLTDLFCTPPYRIMSPFMYGDKMEVCLMSSSAGMLGGDEFLMTIDVRDQCQLTFVSQSYEKILDTKDNKASKILNLNVGRNATLKYIPYPSIPFTGSTFEARNTIHLLNDSTFVYGDVFSCGRVGMGERFGFKSYKSKTKVYVDGGLAYADNTIVMPDKINYTSLGLWGDYTHNSMLYIYSPDKKLLHEIIEKSRSISKKKELFSGSTFCSKGVVIRSLGYNGDELYRFNKEVTSYI